MQNFRNYIKSEFQFDDGVNIVVGANATGKSNLVEAVHLLSTGRSRRTDKDRQLIHFGESFCRLKSRIFSNNDVDDTQDELEILITADQDIRAQKKFMVNGVPKRRMDFAGRISTVLFTPLDLEISLGQPSSRRRFLDETLEQTDYDYRASLITYTKGLRQRNALLELVQKTGSRDEKRFAYWDDLLIKNGGILTKKRGELIDYINNKKKDLFEFMLVYDKSEISEERLQKYKDAEVGAGVTLVGPHRDDVIILYKQEGIEELEDVKYFSSRGQQRLVVLELKLSQISYVSEKNKVKPLLLLDDIFSELDEGHIRHVFDFIGQQQTIVTTTHRDFIPEKLMSNTRLITLG